jgi:rRNA processing protein Krr1/Pno1
MKKTQKLEFKDGTAAFEYSCQFMDCAPMVGKVLTALVEDVSRLEDGRQRCRLKVASNEGGFQMMPCETADNHVPELKGGDLVAYKIIGESADPNSAIAFLRLPGFIVAKLSPVYSLEEGGWLTDISRRP